MRLAALAMGPDRDTGAESDAVPSGVGAMGVQENIPTSRLAAQIWEWWSAARDWKRQYIEPRLRDCQRRRNGEYDGEKLKHIREHSGCDLYFNITEQKCDAAESWLMDVLRPEGEDPWSLEATELPNLPPWVRPHFEELLAQRVDMLGGLPAVGEEGVMQLAVDLKEEILQEAQDLAGKRARNMERKIADQFQEGDFEVAFNEYVTHLCTYPTAFMEGPVYQRRTRVQWERGGMTIKEEVIPTWRAVNPFDLYPAPHARNLNDYYVLEVMVFTGAQLASMRGMPGWSDEAISAVLREKPQDVYLDGDNGRALAENRDPYYNPGDVYQVLKARGHVQGKMLAEWGVEGIQDEDDWYDSLCLLANRRHVLKAQLNPDPAGRRPYFWASFKPVPGSIWGKGIPEVMAHAQDPFNACNRALIDNLAYSSGFWMTYDLLAVPAEYHNLMNKLGPRTALPYDGSKLGQTARKAYDVYQPDCNANQLLPVAQRFQDAADDATKIPRFIQGQSDVGGAGETASGLAMLRSDAAMGIKDVLRHVALHVMRPLVEQIYTDNLMYLDDPELKGDAQVQPKGIIAKLIEAEQWQQRIDFLSLLKTPQAGEVVDVFGWAEVLRALADRLGLDTDKIVPDEDTLRQRIEQQAQQQAALMAQGALPEPQDGGMPQEAMA